MGDISVIGLGLMGAALARALQRAGHGLVVWNRSPGKMQPFRADGIRCAADLSAAIRASPVVLFCVDNYATTRTLLDTPDIPAKLQGKVVVQLSSGTPKEARDAAAWLHGLGAMYLDGAILAGPSEIGTPDATILLSGDEVAQAATKGMLSCLGQGTVRYLGPNVGAASGLDLAWLTTRYANFMGIIHAANLCQSEGVGMDEFIALLADNPTLQSHAQVIQQGSFDHFTASLQVWAEALAHIRQQGADARINTEIPDFIAGLFDRALASGHGQKNVMSLIKVLQQSR